MIIREDINFKRGQDSKKSLAVGNNSLYQRKKRASWLSDTINGINDIAFPVVVEKIDVYENALENILKVGIKPDKIKIVLDSGKFVLEQWRVIQGNIVMHMTLSEKDAEKIAESLIKYDINSSYIFIEKDSTGTYMSIKNLNDYWKRRGWPWKD